MDEIRTIILAAGKGTRMKSRIPKVLHPVCGKPIIHYVLDVVHAVKSSKIYAVLAPKSKEIIKQLPQGIVVVEQKKRLGTADAVKQAAGYLKTYRGTILVLCGDTPLLNQKTIKQLVKKHKKTKAACTLLTTVVLDPKGYGRIIRDGKGDVAAIREDKDAVGLERNIAEINMGVYCFESRDLFRCLKEIKINQSKKEYYLTDIIEILTQEGLSVESLEAEDSLEGLGVNSREDLAQADAAIRKRILTELMAQGVTVVDPKTTYVDTGVKIGQDTVLKPFTFIETDVRIGENCVIGPFARLRSGTRIAQNTEIGNFTEVVRTKIGSGCFMKHFSYLGDSLVGNNVNIGAGTVTANFDGKDKHEIQVKEGAFIGCDSILIAPVKIGKKSIVGAGSIVTKGKNVPDNSIVMGAPAKVVVKRGKR